ncbi:hypothetical protein C8Q75DRAFT_119708 [Abortiporus biennis]|nr:hypothetical protein C8Q75DRAFT_119708 [Abortiporus biennis]
MFRRPKKPSSRPDLRAAGMVLQTPVHSPLTVARKHLKVRVKTLGRRQPALRNLPVELLDLVASHLFNDPRSLSALALTNRTWYRVLRPHIYRAVTFKSLLSFKVFLRAIKNSDILAEWVYEIFLDFSPIPEVYGELDPDTTWQIETALIDTLPQISKAFLRLHLLGLRGVTLIHLRKWKLLRAVFASMAEMVMVDTLILQNCTFPKDVAGWFVRGLPCVQVVTLENCWAHNVEIGWLPTPYLPRNRFHTLSIVQSKTRLYNDFVEYDLYEVLPIFGVTRVRLSIDTPIEANSYVRFVNSLGKEVEVLSLSISLPPSRLETKVFLQSITLKCLINLKTLEFDLMNYEDVVEFIPTISSKILKKRSILV